MLEWVYGCVVSTAEKARDAAQRALGEVPCAEEAYACLQSALTQQKAWATLGRDVTAVVEDLEDARQELAAACTAHGVSLPAAFREQLEAATSSAADTSAAVPVVGTQQLPQASSSSSGQDHASAAPNPEAVTTGDGVNLPRRVVAALLERECAMAQARAVFAQHDQIVAERGLRRVNAQQGVVEAEVIRVRRMVNRLRVAGLAGMAGPGSSGHAVSAASAAASNQKLETLEARLTTYTAQLSHLTSMRNVLSAGVTRTAVEQGQISVWLTAMQVLLRKTVGTLAGSEDGEEGHAVVKELGPLGRGKAKPRLPPELDTPGPLQVGGAEERSRASHGCSHTRHIIMVLSA